MIGEALRLIRVFHDLKQSELSSILEVSQSHLSEIERGKKVPTQELIEKYANEFSLPVSSIWFFDEQMQPGRKISNLDKAKGIIADKVIDFLRLVEQKRAAKDRAKE